MAANFINLTDSIEQWRVKANAVYGTVGDLTNLVSDGTVDYTAVIGQNSDDFTGTPAQFTVTREFGGYSIAITAGGSGYEVSDTILILGTALGGVTPTNDATITVTAVGPGFDITTATVAGTAVSDIISEVNALRTELGSLLNFSLDTTANTFYEAINEHEADIGTVANLLTDGANLTLAVNELETALRGANATYGLDTNSGDVVSALNEVESILRDGGSGVTGYVLNTAANDLVAAINEHEADIGSVASLGTDASNLVLGINELETALRGTRSDYNLTTSASNLVDAVREHESDLGNMNFTATGTSGDHPTTVTYTNLGSTVTSGLNALKAKADFLADEIGGEMADDYNGTDNNIVSALNNLFASSSVSTLNNIYLRRDTQDWVTGGTFRTGPGGIIGGLEETAPGVYAYTDFLIKGYDSNNDMQDRITIKQGNGNVGIGTAPGTTKLKVGGMVDATTGFQWNGQSTDTRYLRTSSNTSQNVATTTNFTGTAQYHGINLDSRFLRIEEGAAQTLLNDVTFAADATFTNNVIIQGTTVASDSLSITEWTQDITGGMFTGNTESGGISAVYDDSTGKITLAIAANGHNHTASNISDFSEAVSDVVGTMVTGNTESGISVTYVDGDNTLDFNVNDPVISLTGEATGSATMTNLGNTAIEVTLNHEAIQDAVGEMLTGNTETGISVVYDDVNNEIDFVLTADPIINLTGDATGAVTLTNLASSTFNLDVAVVDNSHNHTASNISDFTESVQDTVGAMVSPTNTEAGMSVTYDDETGKLNFDANDFSITLTGDVTGTATVNNLGATSISTTVGNNSHTHDDRYYTETESDSRFINADGDTMTGTLNGTTFSATENMYIGANGGGDTDLFFYDDNNNDWRTFKWDDSSNEFQLEDNGGTMRSVVHSGNVAGYTVTNATTSASCSGNSATASQVYVTETDSNQDYAICGVIKSDNQSGNEAVYADNAIKFNASTNTLTCTNFAGTATTAKYADLAEKYLADQEYSIGTVMSVGGTAEITASTTNNSHSVVGVVSENPAYLMNSELEDGTSVALKGRVPVRITGSVIKGDRLAPSSQAGLAETNNSRDAWSFAIALEDSTGDMVEAVIL